MMLPRHIPPTASPLVFADWWRGVAPAASADADFASALAAYLGAAHVFTAASGRTALRLLLETLHRRSPQRREVALPGYTCPSVAKVILDAGLTPVAVEMDPATLNMLPEALPQAVTGRTLAVIVVHPFGLPVDAEPAVQQARAAGAVLIEDVAQSMGARQGGQRLGVAHDVGLYSFGPGKPLALGGGGAVATRDPLLARDLAAAWHALPAVQGFGGIWAWARLALFSLAFRPSLWYWATRAGAQRVGEHEESWGYAMRGLATHSAATGVAALERLDGVNAARRMRGQTLLEALTPAAGVVLPRLGGDTPEPIYLRLPLLMPDQRAADELARRAAEAGLGVGRMYRRTLAEFFPALDLPSLPGATQVARRLATLPTNHHLRAEDLARLAALVRSL